MPFFVRCGLFRLLRKTDCVFCNRLVHYWKIDFSWRRGVWVVGFGWSARLLDLRILCNQKALYIIWGYDWCWWSCIEREDGVFFTRIYLLGCVKYYFGEDKLVKRTWYIDFSVIICHHTIM